MISGAEMKLWARIITHSLCGCGVLLLIALPGNKYGWMQEMDPSASLPPVKDASGNRAMFTFLLLIVIVASQLTIGLVTLNKWEKIISLVLILAAIGAWLL